MTDNPIRTARGKRVSRGATALTYGLVVGLIAVAGIAAVTSVGESVEDLFLDVSGQMEKGLTQPQGPTVPNKAPSITLGRSQSAFVNAGPQSVTGFTTGFDPGDPSEAAQTIAEFLVTADDTSLFSVQPAIDTGGTLTYTPQGANTGSTLVRVRVRDTGGTANGGTDLSSETTFTITINPAPGRDIFYSCHGQSSFVVIAENINNHTITRTNDRRAFDGIADACRALGYRPLGTADNDADDTLNYSDEVNALKCHCCRFAPSNNVWHYEQNDPGGGRRNCVPQNPEIASQISSGEVVAGFVSHICSGIGAYSLTGNITTLDGSTNSISGASGTFNDIGSGGGYLDGTINNDDILYTGTPDFLLCGSSSGP